MSDTPKPPEGEPKPERPNARLPLTENQNSEGEMVFYYSREHRLAKAPKSVRDLHKETGPVKFSLLRPLISTKPKAIMFVSILILTVMTILTYFGYPADENQILGGNAISAAALRYEGTTIIVLTKKVQDKKSPYTGTVDIAVSPVLKNGGEPLVEPYRISFTQKEEEEYRFALPFEDEELLIFIQGGADSLEFKLKTQ
jgi:hypothetical protein